eukprot:gene28789-35710_t
MLIRWTQTAAALEAEGADRRHAARHHDGSELQLAKAYWMPTTWRWTTVGGVTTASKWMEALRATEGVDGTAGGVEGFTRKESSGRHSKKLMNSQWRRRNDRAKVGNWDGTIVEGSALGVSVLGANEIEGAAVGAVASAVVVMPTPNVTVVNAGNWSAVRSEKVSVVREVMPLKYVTLSSTIVTVCDTSFKGCSSLLVIFFPASVTYIGLQAFNGCNALQTVVITSRTSGSALVLSDTVWYQCTSLTTVTIGSELLVILDQTFYGCTSLISVTIPETVTTFGTLVFQGCSSLQSVRIPASVTLIGYGAALDLLHAQIHQSGAIAGFLQQLSFIYELYAFAATNSLVAINIPASVTSIGQGSFQSSQLFCRVWDSTISRTISDYAWTYTGLANNNSRGC